MSVWKLLRGRWGTGDAETDDIRIDASTNSIQTVDYSHHEIHAGSTYHVFVEASGGANTKATISFQTPDSTQWFHAVVTAVSNVAANLTIGEAATVTAASGSDFVPRNRNRNIATASTVISAGSAGGAGNATTGGTVTDFGTIIDEYQIGSGKTGGDARSIDEWVLKRNTVYAFEMESLAATSVIKIEVDYYQHTDRH